MAYFKLSLLTPYSESKKSISIDTYNAIYYEDLITEFESQLQSYDSNIQLKESENKDLIDSYSRNLAASNSFAVKKKTTSFSYNEKVTFSQNAQKTLSFDMNRYIIKENEYLENPFVNLIQDGSQILLTDQYNNEYFFTVTSIKYNFKETNIIYSYTCQDSFSYQTSRQNQSYSIDNDISDIDFIGAKTADWWIVHKVVPECYLTNYLYIPCSRALYENKDGVYIICNNLANKTDVKRIIKEPHTPPTYTANGTIIQENDIDYYKTFAYSCSGMNANSVLIDIAKKIDMQLKTFEHARIKVIDYDQDDNAITERTKYFDRFFWIEPLKNNQRVGLTYSPRRDIQSFDLTHNGQSLTTMLNVQGPTYNDEIITLIPDIPLFFHNYFLRPEWDQVDFSAGMFTQACIGESFNGLDSYTLQDLTSSNSRFGFVKITDQGNEKIQWQTITIDDTNFILLQIYNSNNNRFVSNSDIYNHFTFKYDDKESEIKFTKAEGLPIVLKPTDEAWFLAQPTDDATSYMIYHPGQANSILDNTKSVYIAIAYSDISSLTNYEVTFAEVFVKFYRDTTKEELEFATIADKCPWLENKIIDFNYFKEQNILSNKEYNSLLDILHNNLRKVNAKLIYYTKAYYNALHDKTEIIARLTNQLDTLGAACQAAIIDSLAETGSVKDDSYFQKAYDVVFTEGTQSTDALLDYNLIISDYFTKYFNSQQRFLKNIYNFKQYFNESNPLKGKKVYNYKIEIEQPSTIEELMQLEKFYGFSSNKFIGLNNQNYPYIHYVGYNENADFTDLEEYGKPLLPIFLNQQGKISQIAVASKDMWLNGSLYRYPNFNGKERFCDSQEKIKYNENTKYLKLSFKLPIQNDNKYYWIYSNTEKRYINKSNQNYTKQDHDEFITTDTTLTGLYWLSIIDSSNNKKYSSLCRIDDLQKEQEENEENPRYYAYMSLMHQGEWEETDLQASTVTVKQKDILTVILSQESSFEEETYLSIKSGIQILVQPVYYDAGYHVFTHEGVSETYTLDQTKVCAGLIAATTLSIKENWVYTHFNSKEVYIESRPIYRKIEKTQQVLDEMIKWAAGNLFYNISKGKTRDDLENEKKDYFTETQLTFDSWKGKDGEYAKKAYMLSFPVNDFFIKGPKYRVVEKEIYHEGSDTNEQKYIFERLNQKGQTLTEYLKYYFKDPKYVSRVIENPYLFEDYQQLSFVSEDNESSRYRRVIDNPYAGSIAAGIVAAPMFGPATCLDIPTLIAGGVTAVIAGAVIDAIAETAQHWDTAGFTTRDYFYENRLNERVSGFRPDEDLHGNLIYAPTNESFDKYKKYGNNFKAKIKNSTSVTLTSWQDWNETKQEGFWSEITEQGSSITLTAAKNADKFFYPLFEKHVSYDIYSMLYRNELKEKWKDKIKYCPIEHIPDVYFIDKNVYPLTKTDSVSVHDKVYMLWIRSFGAKISDSNNPQAHSTLIKKFDDFDSFLRTYTENGFSANYFYPLLEFAIPVSLAGFKWDEVPSMALEDIIKSNNRWSFDPHYTSYTHIYKIKSNNLSGQEGGYVTFFRVQDYYRTDLDVFMKMPDNIAMALPRLFDSNTRNDFDYLAQNDAVAGFYEDVDLKTDLVKANTKEEDFNMSSAYYDKDGVRIYTIKQLKERSSYVYLRNFTYEKEEVGIIKEFHTDFSEYSISHDVDENQNTYITGINEKILDDIESVKFELFETVSSLEQANIENKWGFDNSKIEEFLAGTHDFISVKKVIIQGNPIILYLTVDDVATIDGKSNGTFWLKYHNRMDTPTLFATAATIEAQLTEYWMQAYNASKFCEYFLPESWTPVANQKNNLFSQGVYVTYKDDNNEDVAELLPTFLPEVNIWKQDGKVILKKYKYSFNAIKSYYNFEENNKNKWMTNTQYVLEDQKITNDSQTIIKENYAIRNAFKNIYWKSDQEIENDISKWDIEEIGTTTYYYSNVGGMTWNQLVQQQFSESRFINFSGWYLMAINWLRHHYTDYDLQEYNDAKNEHEKIWRMLYLKYGHILLETAYKSETATTSTELFEEALLYMKDRATPERAYTIAIIDAALLDGYNGAEIRIGDGIQVKASDYYNQQDLIYKSLTQYLFITDINYTLRNPSNISLTVNAIKYADTIVKRLAKLIK